MQLCLHLCACILSLCVVHEKLCSHNIMTGFFCYRAARADCWWRRVPAAHVKVRHLPSLELQWELSDAALCLCQ